MRNGADEVDGIGIFFSSSFRDSRSSLGIGEPDEKGLSDLNGVLVFDNASLARDDFTLGLAKEEGVDVATLLTGAPDPGCTYTGF